MVERCKCSVSTGLPSSLLTCDSAFGHPLGATGARQVVTALAELRRQDKRIAVTSMCVGTVSSQPRSPRSQLLLMNPQGMGMAGIFVSEH